MTGSNPPARLTVITGPSGVGKGSLVKELLQRHQEIWLSISATTRPPRNGEIDGKHYFFLNQETFSKIQNSAGLLEWAEFAGNKYGTPLKPVQEKIKEGKQVLLEIELEGARQVKRNFPNSFHIFLAPPSLEELEKRIRGRATEEEDSILKRLNRAKEELKAQKEFDAVIINNDLIKAVKEVEEIMTLV